MRAALLTIGDELIGGQALDTNAFYLSASLNAMGIEVARILSVGDDAGEISWALKLAILDTDLVFVTGGLGPTADDVTKEAVAGALGRDLVVDSGLRERLGRRFKGHESATADVIEALAAIPRGARTIENPVGAAPGLAIEHAGKTIYLLPGVPREMEAIFNTISPALESLPKAEIVMTRVLKTTGLRESAAARMLAQAAGELNVRLGYLPGPAGVDLRLAATSHDAAGAEKILDDATRAVVSALGTHVYSTCGEEIQFVVGRLLLDTGSTLAVAESCTGGLIGHLLTQVPGISASLDRVVVSYSNRAKVESVAVPEEILRSHGAVSPEVAEAMASGVRSIAQSDIGLSATGIAGPSGGSDEKPVGLVYFGLACKEGYTPGSKVFTGTRDIIKLRAAVHALDMLRRHLLRLRGQTGGKD